MVAWCFPRPARPFPSRPPVNVTQSLAEWLLVLAVVLLPVDVALRRLVIGRERPVRRDPRIQPGARTSRDRGSRRAKGKAEENPDRATGENLRGGRAGVGHETPGTPAPVALAGGFGPGRQRGPRGAGRAPVRGDK